MTSAAWKLQQKKKLKKDQKVMMRRKIQRLESKRKKEIVTYVDRLCTYVETQHHHHHHNRNSNGDDDDDDGNKNENHGIPLNKLPSHLHRPKFLSGNKKQRRKINIQWLINRHAHGRIRFENRPTTKENGLVRMKTWIVIPTTKQTHNSNDIDGPIINNRNNETTKDGAIAAMREDSEDSERNDNDNDNNKINETSKDNEVSAVRENSEDSEDTDGPNKEPKKNNKSSKRKKKRNDNVDHTNDSLFIEQYVTRMCDHVVTHPNQRIRLGDFTSSKKKFSRRCGDKPSCLEFTSHRRIIEQYANERLQIESMKDVETNKTQNWVVLHPKNPRRMKKKNNNNNTMKQQQQQEQQPVSNNDNQTTKNSNDGTSTSSRDVDEYTPTPYQIAIVRARAAAGAARAAARDRDDIQQFILAVCRTVEKYTKNDTGGGVALMGLMDRVYRHGYMKPKCFKRMKLEKIINRYGKDCLEIIYKRMSKRKKVVKRVASLRPKSMHETSFPTNKEKDRTNELKRLHIVSQSIIKNGEQDDDDDDGSDGDSTDGDSSGGGGGNDIDRYEPVILKTPNGEETYPFIVDYCPSRGL